MLLQNEYDQKAKELIAHVKELQIEKVRSFKDALKLIPRIIKIVESEYWQLGAEDKKALACAIINQLVDIPFLLESAENAIFSAAIDVAIDVLNQLVGQNWYERLINN